VGSKLKERRHRHDPFHQRAKKEGFAARAVYKLQEIDEKVRLFRPGQRVLDLGCKPGSWLQYAASRVGGGAKLVGIDRTPIDVVIPGARVMVGDVFAVSIADLVGDLGGFDVVLSDMAPDTSGIRSMDQARSEALFERALEIAEQTLDRGGAFVGKLFQGPAFQALVNRCREGFEKVQVVKPAGSRAESIETYVVATGRR
jgi:23S rRNA (uridine2552-2'-O)-methyltransferase